MRSHEWIDRRSLELHKAVATKLEKNPDLLEVARANVARWLASDSNPVLEQWQRLLNSTPIPELLIRERDLVPAL